MFRCKHDLQLVEEDYVEIDFSFDETLTFSIEAAPNDLMQTSTFCKLQFTYIPQDSQVSQQQNTSTLQFGKLQPASGDKNMNLRLLSLRCLKCKKKFRFSSAMLKKVLDVIRVEHKKEILNRQSFTAQIVISS